MNKNVFSTTDLPLATFLKCRGICLCEKPYDPSSKEWCFEDVEKCNSLVSTLANGKGDVKVLEYEMHRKSLLSIAKRVAK
jgi:hypothetical protein